MSDKIVVQDVNKLYQYGNTLKAMAIQLEKDYNALLSATKDQAQNWGDRNFESVKSSLDDCIKVIRVEKDKITSLGNDVIRLADKIKSIL